jgi:hypothetical protein
VRRPPGDVTFGDETEDVLIEVFGGLAVALAVPSASSTST